ncbi:hypothetical protein ENKNEFLB_03675 [Nocardioides aquaticus]|uniref:Uncharacterized protein n=3 Tax=Nocardioides aquaticus TaxID=160826 RepID=A0ABX8EL53_9ACTN|nr:hypothetical protein [Nocardioides aquaticus]QVT81267.1 hypothetical protein ENKNEFLB_03675 [Nocardioides aquaticus]
MTPDAQPDHRLFLTRDQEDVAAIDALVARARAAGGGRVPLATFVDDLGRRARRTPIQALPLRGVHRAWTWDATDRRDPRWWPQGVTTGSAGGRHLVVVAWYAKHRPGQPGEPAKGQGVRVAVLDPERRRYEHVLVVVARGSGDAATGRPLVAHAGGLAWTGSWLHVAATKRGFASCHLEDLVELPAGPLRDAHFGYRYVLPVRLAHRAGAEDGTEPLRYSFFSSAPAGTDGASDLLVGEYARGRQTRRLARFPLDDDGLPVLGPDGRAHPVLGEGVAQMQGVVDLGDRLVATASHGPWGPGSVWSGPHGALRERRRALPMGPEDLAHDPATGLLWSATEHPRRRWVVAMRADRF